MGLKRRGMHALSSTWLDTGTTGDICSMNGADLPGMLPDMLPRLWAFALRISGDRHDAEDLVQRACVRALERAHQLQPDTDPLSWMFSIVHTGESLLGSGDCRRCAGQQRAARPGNDGSAAILSGTLGTAAQHDCRRSDGEVSYGSGDRPVWHARGDCRADGVHRVACGSLDDGLDVEDGR